MRKRTQIQHAMLVIRRTFVDELAFVLTPRASVSPWTDTKA
jgi:hypothetical protein